MHIHTNDEAINRYSGHEMSEIVKRRSCLDTKSNHIMNEYCCSYNRRPKLCFGT